MRKKKDGEGPGQPVDPREVLDRLASLPIEKWNYRWDDPSTRHIGPMAQDFSEAFGVGREDRIAVGDAVGVAFASIKALHQIFEEQERELAELRSEAAELRDLLHRALGRAPSRAAGD